MRIFKGNRWNNISLSMKLFWSAFGLVGFFLVMQSILSYQAFYRAVGDITRQWDENALQYARSNVEKEMQDMSQYSLQFSGNEQLKDLLAKWQNTESLSYQRLDIENDIHSLLNVLTAGYENISNIAVYFSEETFSSNLSSFPDWKAADLEEFILQAEASPDGVAMFETGSGENVDIIFAVPIDMDAGQEALLTVSMQKEWIGNIIKDGVCISIYDAEKGYSVYVADGIREITDDPSVLLTDSVEYETHYIKGQYRITTLLSQHYGWIYAICSDISESTTPLRRIIWFAIIGLCLCLTLAALFSRLLVGKVMEPVEILSHTFEDSIEAKEPVQVILRNRRKKFSDILMFYFFATCIIPMLILIISYYSAVNVVLKNTLKEAVIQYMEQAENSADAFLGRANRMTVTLSINPNMQDIMLNTKNGITPATEQINDFLQTVAWASLPMERQANVLMYDSSGNMVISSQGTAENMKGNVLDYYVDKNYPFSILEIEEGELHFYHNIRSVLPETLHSLLGYLCINISLEEFQTSFTGTEIENMTTMIIGEDGASIIPEDKKWSLSDTLMALIDDCTDNTVILEENKYLYGCIRMMQQDWVILCAVPLDEMLAARYNLIEGSVVIMLLMVCIILWIGYGLSSRFSRSVEVLQYNLLGWSDEKSHGDLSVGVEDNEIVRIATTFNVMTERIKQLVSDAYQAKINEVKLENDYRKAESLALQSQINPHFLYNTFESMKYMLREYRTEEAIGMIDMLGDLFRAAANNHTKLIPVFEEVEYARAYMSLQCIRYENQIDVRFEMDDNTLDIPVPKLILQPILENAIIHGKRNDGSLLVIIVSTKLKDDTLNITVRNNGLSIPKPKLQSLREAMTNSNDMDNSIGLINVFRRIRLYFGPSYGASIQNLDEGGVVVTLHIPATQ